MKGATAEPCVKKMSAPSSTIIMTTGASHHFFRMRRNAQNSPSIPNVALLMTSPLFADDSSSRGSRSSQNRRHRFDEDLEIQPQGPLVDVLHVQLHPSLEWQPAPPIHLPQARDPRTHAEPAAVPVLVEPVVIADRQRPRADEAHVASQHVDE